MSLQFELYTVLAGDQWPSVPEGTRQPHLHQNHDNTRSPCEMYERIRTKYASPAAGVQIYMHNDVDIFAPFWERRVMELFEYPEVAVVGLGGATSLGHPDLYKRPYRLSDMARDGYMSNQKDWETHGSWLYGERRVAVIDAFFMAVRSDFLAQIGGWPTKHLTHHCLDLWLCLEAARHGKEVWVVGVECLHRGGGTSTKKEYAEAKWLQGLSVDTDHQAPHRWLYEQYRDVLPLSIK